jgi:hypothetical protein
MQLRRYGNTGCDALYKKIMMGKACVRQEEGLSGWAVGWGCTDYWKIWVIRNIYFIETRAKYRTVSYYLHYTYIAYA